MTLHRLLAHAVALLALVTSASSASAQIAVSGNDNKVLFVNGVMTVVPNAPADTVSVIDLKASPPRVIGEVAVPVSVVGPQLSMALTPDESLAILTAYLKVDPADRTKVTPNSQVALIDVKASPPKVLATLKAGKGASGISINRAGTLALVSNLVDGTVSVIDVKGSPPKVLATLTAGAGASGISINRASTLALVSNLVDGTVSVFTIQGKTVTPAGTVEIGGEEAGGGMVAITPDGKWALASRSLDNKLSLLSIKGSKVEYTKRDIVQGQRPVVLDITGNGAFAIVASLVGGLSGDSESVSLIDLTAKPPRVVDTIGVLGLTSEGLKIAPDSSVVAVVLHNGRNRAKDADKLVLLRVTGKSLSRVAEAPIGHRSQGVAWAADAKTLLVGNMAEKDYWVFSWDGSTLKDTAQRVRVNGGPVGIRIADK